MNRRRWGFGMILAGFTLIALAFATAAFDALVGGCSRKVYGGCPAMLPIPLWVFGFLLIVGFVLAGVGLRLTPHPFEHFEVL